ncbi:MAG: MFS transporter [Ruminococcaceae bacterium]|jgi:MFS family permease|nr:MFS transporter [Oscillospiraceae bacterium]
MDQRPQEVKPALWTKDFTIITVGSVISMLGSVLSGFAMSLLVLDYTDSTFLFALYNVLYMLPHAVMPALCGPFLDRFSRRRTIYTLDFITAGLYVAMALVFAGGYFNFTLLAIGCVLIGSIGSVYRVAYDSFYPLLITEGNYSKAYSVASTLETLTMVMTPLSALLYNQVGIVPLFLFDAATYLIAAVMETRITAREHYIDKQRANRTEARMSRQMLADFKEGMRYLWSEKGLLAVAVYFCFSAFASGASQTLDLPYFKGRFPNGEYIFMLVWGMASVGRAIGGGVHYKLRLAKERKYQIALTVYVVISLLEGTYLYTPVPAMMVMCFFTGILGVTSYNIRIAGTQRYVPDEKKGRFNGAFGTIETVGMVAGQLISGALAEFLPIRGIISGVMAITVAAALVFIGGNRSEVSNIYNTED